MEFFEFNAPLTAPAYLMKEVADNYETAVKRIAERTDKLNEALRLAAIKPETFQRLASKLFKDKEAAYGNAEFFDSKSARELADYVLSVYYPKVDDELDMLDRMVFPNADVICDAAFTTNEEWANSLRRLGIGGSDGGIIQGVSHYGTLQSIYHNKIGTPMYETDTGKEKIFERGHVLEDKVIDAFCKRTAAKRIRDTRMFRSKSHPHSIADIDAILRMPDGSTCIFEAKSAMKEKKSAWRYDRIPPSYLIQTRHYPGVLDDDRIKATYIGCLFTIDLDIGGDYVASEYDTTDFLSHKVDRDTDREQEILDSEEEFWTEYIEAGKEPEKSGDVDKDLKLIKAINGPFDTSLPPIKLETEFKDKIIQYNKYSDEISKHEKKIAAIKTERDQIKLDLLRELGTHTTGTVDSDDGKYFEVKFTPTTKRMVDEDLMKDQYPDAWEECPSNPLFWASFKTNFPDIWKICPENKKCWEEFAKRYPDAAEKCVSMNTESGQRFTIKEKLSMSRPRLI